MALLAHRVQLDLLGQRVQLVRKVHREKPEQLALPAQPDQQARKDRQGQMALTEPMVRMELPDHKAHRETRERPGLLALPERLERQAQRVRHLQGLDLSA